LLRSNPATATPNTAQPIAAVRNDLHLDTGVRDMHPRSNIDFGWPLVVVPPAAASHGGAYDGPNVTTTGQKAAEARGASQSVQRMNASKLPLLGIRVRGRW
jgi:hypothetical protein